jgi:hypothetical protein
MAMRSPATAQGLTADRVLINVDTGAHRELVNSRFAYVSVSRAENEAQIYTNDGTSLETALGKDVSKSAALTPSRSVSFEQGTVGQIVSL